MLFQTCTSFFLLFSTKEGILKNVCNQTVAGKLSVVAIDFNSNLL